MNQLLSVIVALAVVAMIQGRSPPRPELPCTKEYNPVCGQDGRTYGNPCTLRNSGVGKLRDGKCPECAVPFIYRPVCGEYGYTYSNEYVANCLGVTIVRQGNC